MLASFPQQRKLERTMMLGSLMALIVVLSILMATVKAQSPPFDPNIVTAAVTCPTRLIQFMNFDLNLVGDGPNNYFPGTNPCTCLANCLNKTGCTNFIINPGNGDCYLKTPDTSSGKKTVFKIRPDITIDGSFSRNTLPGLFPNRASCLDACNKNPNCNYVTISPDGTCMLEPGQVNAAGTGLILALPPKSSPPPSPSPSPSPPLSPSASPASPSTLAESSTSETTSTSTTTSLTSASIVTSIGLQSSNGPLSPSNVNDGVGSTFSPTVVSKGGAGATDSNSSSGSSALPIALGIGAALLVACAVLAGVIISRRRRKSHTEFALKELTNPASVVFSSIAYPHGPNPDGSQHFAAGQASMIAQPVQVSPIPAERYHDQGVPGSEVDLHFTNGMEKQGLFDQSTILAQPSLNEKNQPTQVSTTVLQQPTSSSLYQLSSLDKKASTSSPGISRWTPDQVSMALLQSRATPHAVQVLRANNVDGSRLLVLDLQSLYSLGLDDMTSRKLLLAIHEIKNAESTSSADGDALPQYS
ncbi:hypothetical protein HDU97_001447 [Phlyctochytrium planicorne]|nr:hypothetical protein HDU97_001447 [Phlyctochytrium planicorne]